MLKLNVKLSYTILKNYQVINFQECVEKLVDLFPNQIIGVKDSTYNLFETLRIKKFSVYQVQVQTFKRS